MIIIKTLSLLTFLYKKNVAIAGLPLQKLCRVRSHFAASE
jgi:hypothetical protein